MHKVGYIFFILFVISACNKEKRFQKNIEGKWEVEKIVQGNENLMEEFRNDIGYFEYLIFYPSSDVSIVYIHYPLQVDITGNYSFTENDSKIYLAIHWDDGRIWYEPAMTTEWEVKKIGANKMKLINTNFTSSAEYVEIQLNKVGVFE